MAKCVLSLFSIYVTHAQKHEALLTTCEQVLAPSIQNGDNTTPPCVLVFYSHHRPWLAHKDAAIFHLAEQRGWKCERFLERKYTVGPYNVLLRQDADDFWLADVSGGWRG